MRVIWVWTSGSPITHELTLEKKMCVPHIHLPVQFTSTTPYFQRRFEQPVREARTYEVMMVYTFQATHQPIAPQTSRDTARRALLADGGVSEASGSSDLRLGVAQFRP